MEDFIRFTLKGYTMKKQWQSKFDLGDVVNLKLEVDPLAGGMVTQVVFSGDIPKYQITWADSQVTYHFEYELISSEKKVNEKNT